MLASILTTLMNAYLRGLPSWRSLANGNVVRVSRAMAIAANVMNSGWPATLSKVAMGCLSNSNMPVSNTVEVISEKLPVLNTLSSSIPLLLYLK